MQASVVSQKFPEEVGSLPTVMPAKAGIQRSDFPGFRLSRAAARSAGMTSELDNECLRQDQQAPNLSEAS